MIQLENPTSKESRSFERRARIGRHPDNSLVLPSPTVSSTHAQIEWRQNGYYLRDLGSVNGTFVGDEPTEGWTRLEVGADIRFGPENSWKIIEVSRPPTARSGGTGMRLVGLDGTHIPIPDDRLSIGCGADVDVQLPNEPDGLRATLFFDEDEVWIQAREGGEVAVRGQKLQGGELAQLEPGVRFSVGAQTWTLELDELTTFEATVQAGLPPRSYGTVHLRLTQAGDYGQIFIRSGMLEVEFTEQELRFALLWVLAEQLRSGGDVSGWVDDEDLRVGIWGRRVASEQATSTLAKLIHDTRTMFIKAGIEGLFIEKKRGRTRLRLGPDQVELIR